jgi:hypothetical protein
MEIFVISLANAAVHQVGLQIQKEISSFSSPNDY